MTHSEKKNTKVVAGGAGFVFLVWYTHLLFVTQQKWFHIVWFCMLVYISYSIYHFLLAQKEIDK